MHRSGEFTHTFEELPLVRYGANGVRYAGALLNECAVTFVYEMDEYAEFESLSVSRVQVPAFAPGDWRNPVMADLSEDEPLYTLIAASAMAEREAAEEAIFQAECGGFSPRSDEADRRSDYLASVL